MQNEMNQMKNEILTNYQQLSMNNEREQSLLEAIRSEQYDQIVIDFMDKKMSALSLIKQHDTNRKIVDVLKESDFQEITVKSHQGKIVRLLNTIKVKFS